MSETKYVYFGVYARGESVRMLAHHCNIKFEDERLSFEQFGPRKAAGEFTNGQLPVWIENGKQFNQSLAILRMLGARHGLYSHDPEEMWRIDSAAETSVDWLAKIYPNLMGNQNEETHKKYLESIEGFTHWLHKTLGGPLAKGDYVAGEKLTIADFAVSAVIFSEVYNEHLNGGHHYRHPAKEIMESKHNVKKYIEHMKEVLHKYLEHRPAAGF